MQYETLLKDDAEIYNDSERDYARMPFELRVMEAALDVVSTQLPLAEVKGRCIVCICTGCCSQIMSRERRPGHSVLSGAHLALSRKS